jgi:hypothetical protein
VYGVSLSKVPESKGIQKDPKRLKFWALGFSVKTFPIKISFHFIKRAGRGQKFCTIFKKIPPPPNPKNSQKNYNVKQSKQYNNNSHSICNNKSLFLIFLLLSQKEKNFLSQKLKFMFFQSKSHEF